MLKRVLGMAQGLWVLELALAQLDWKELWELKPELAWLVEWGLLV